MQKNFKVQRKNGTFSLDVYDHKVERLDQYIVQFSLKDPWVIPQKRPYKNDKSWIMGWLFIYFAHFVHESRISDSNTNEGSKASMRKYNVFCSIVLAGYSMIFKVSPYLKQFLIKEYGKVDPVYFFANGILALLGLFILYLTFLTVIGKMMDLILGSKNHSE